MKVLFDHQCFAVNRYNGISKYFCELFPLFVKEGIELDLPFTLTQSVCLLPLGLKKFKPLPEGMDERIVRRLNKYVGKAEVIRELRRGNYDLVHPTQYRPYVFKYAKSPVVVTVHDMTQENYRGTAYELPNWSKEIAGKRECILHSDRIIAVSENTKKDILRFYPEVPEEKITVILHGYSPAPLCAEPNPYGKYILFVGKRFNYKNFDAFLRAVAPLLKEDSELSLVCTGQDFTAAERQLISELGVADKCRSRFLSEDELRTAYRHALVFVYPSLCEGFGLPILEAFSQDCPVCLSAASCFPEIAGDAAAYFDPTDIDSMRDAIAGVISSPALRSSLIEAGRKRLGNFSWEKSAAAHIEVYRSVLKENQKL